MAKGNKQTQSNGSHLGFARLRATGDKLRGNFGTAEYKQFVLGLIFEVASLGDTVLSGGLRVPVEFPYKSR